MKLAAQLDGVIFHRCGFAKIVIPSQTNPELQPPNHVPPRPDNRCEVPQLAYQTRHLLYACVRAVQWPLFQHRADLVDFSNRHGNAHRLRVNHKPQDLLCNHPVG